MRTPLYYTLRQMKPQIHARGRLLRKFTDKIGLAYLGSMHQHDDEYDAIRGFTASTSHRDAHYAVGTYEGHNIRMVDRFDIQKRSGSAKQPQSWVIFEFELQVIDIPHVFFVPTGKNGSVYERIFNANIHMQPLNSILHHVNHSPNFHGKYQILSRPTHSHRVESLLTSPVIFGIGEKLWPYALEIDRNKLYIYISGASVTESSLSTACIAGMWLVDELNAA
ncbi:hypothetical protein KI440_02135 [Candidatus Saccharibacteria bacterium TM7i]|nr:hypothetical protein KI440_02135 [Candidatus Saccharibacteria bacterium TM7i]